MGWLGGPYRTEREAWEAHQKKDKTMAIDKMKFRAVATINSDRREPVSYEEIVSRFMPRDPLSNLIARAGACIQRSGLDPVADNVTITVRFYNHGGDRG